MASNTTAEISRLDLQELRTPSSASITDVRHLSSYNWIEASNSTPTITVPGSPALWSVPRVPQQLKKDSGLIYIAQNAARHPNSPLEPLFRALYITHPSYDIRSTDVVTDRNNIRKLLSFISSGTTKNEVESFTIGIEVVKNTAILCREETATHEFIGPDEFRGYGHEFEKAYTTCQVRGSTGHHRIITYRFGDLNLIVRHETDGYVDAGTKIPSSNQTNSKGHGIDGLSSVLESLSLSQSDGSTNSKLIVREEGQVVPIESTLEIKTRVFHKPLTVQELAPQLWVSQTPKLVRAYHHKGRFERPEVEDVAAEIKSWEERNQGDLKKLNALIQKIIKVVKGYGGSAVLKYDAKGDKLGVCKVDGRKMLPNDLYSKWDDRDNSEAEANDDISQGAKIAQMKQPSLSAVSTPQYARASRANRAIAVDNPPGCCQDCNQNWRRGLQPPCFQDTLLGIAC
jgi:hypothetical protein